MMKISHYPDIFFCLFILICCLKYLQWRVGATTKPHFLKIIHLLVGGQPIPAGLPYPPPKILEQWLFTDNEMTLEYYITENDENFL